MWEFRNEASIADLVQGLSFEQLNISRTFRLGLLRLCESWGSLREKESSSRAKKKGFRAKHAKTRKDAKRFHAVCEIACSLPNAAWAAASLAIGTRYGEHDT